MPRRQARLLTAGLVSAIVANVALITYLASEGYAFFAGNVVAIVICAVALVIVRARREP